VHVHKVSFQATALAGIQRALLSHYDENKRDLPWRENADPYRVWVSEIMLQQTRVETVKPYYERWMRRFPTVDALADAPVDDVLKAWEGLGYYSRARNLQKGALLVRERFNGTLPQQPAALREVPGIGEYTAGAIASIAYGQRAPAVDGNVRRVLHRLLDRASIPARDLTVLAGALVPAQRAGDFNQALMELGATICTARVARCTACPVSAHCGAFASGTQLERPAARVTKPVPERSYVTLVVADPDGRVLLRRRPEKGLLAGLWEFPAEQITGDPAAAVPALLHRLVRSRARPRFVGTFDHTFSHFRARYHTYRIDLRRGLRQDPADALRWIAYTSIGELSLPTAQRRIAAAAWTCTR
jgi:A/G-specific adenine glycosylase